MAGDTIQDATFTTDEDTTLAGAVSLPADDGTGTVWAVTAINGDTVTFGSAIPLPSGALLTFNADGTFSYSPNGQFDYLDEGSIITLSDSFTYTVSDGAGGTDTATATIIVDGVNDAPMAADDAFVTDEDTALAGNMLSDNGNGADRDADAASRLTVTAVDGNAGVIGNEITLDSGALLTVNADGTFAYDPNGAFEGLNDGETAVDSVTYTIADGKGGTDTATASFTVNGVGDQPTPAFSIVGTVTFDGGHEDVINAGALDTFAIADGTIALSFSTDATEGRQYLFSKDDPGGADGFAAWLQNDTLYVGDPTGESDATLRVDGVDIDAGTTYQLAVSFGGAGLQVWLDGTLVASDADNTAGLETITGSLLFGATTGGGGSAHQAFDGTIGDIAFYDGRLSATDIAAITGTVAAPAGAEEPDALDLSGGHGHDNDRRQGGNHDANDRGSWLAGFDVQGRFSDSTDPTFDFAALEVRHGRDRAGHGGDDAFDILSVDRDGPEDLRGHGHAVSDIGDPVDLSFGPVDHHVSDISDFLFG